MAVIRDKRWAQATELLRQRIKVAVAQSGVVVQREIVMQLSKRGSTRALGNIAAPAGTPPGVQSGTLRRSIQIDPSHLNDRNPAVRVGTNVVYARIHEFGGTITAKGKALAIPLNAQARAWSAQGVALRSLDLFVITGRKGPLLCQRKGQDVIPMFALRQSVRMPMRPYMRPGLRAARPQIAKAFRAAGFKVS